MRSPKTRTMRFAMLLSALLAASGLVLADPSPRLGVTVAPVGEELAGYLGISGGALVLSVEKGSPADRAGFKARDIIVEWNDKTVKSAEDLVAEVKSASPGKTVEIKVLRRGKELTLKPKLGGRKVKAREEKREEPEKPKPGFLGVAFGPVPPPVAEYLGLGDSPGVMVMDVVDDSPAEKAGLKKRDIIRKVDGKPARDPERFRRLIAGHKAGEKVKIEYLRAGRRHEVTVELGVRPKKLVELKPFVSPLYRGGPKVEMKKGKMIFKWTDPDGKEHEKIIVVPFGDFEKGLEFGDEDFDVPNIEELRKHIEQSMKEARKQWEQFSKEMEKMHKKLREEVKSGHGKTGVFSKPEGENRSVVVEKNSSLIVSQSDGLEISIRTEDGKKTVSVKKDGKVIAEKLPYDKVNTLPGDIQKRIKEIERGVKIKIGPIRFKSPEKKKIPGGKKVKEKHVLGLPTERI